jgi:hypothetical protein
MADSKRTCKRRKTYMPLTTVNGAAGNVSLTKLTPPPPRHCTGKSQTPLMRFAVDLLKIRHSL